MKLKSTKRSLCLCVVALLTAAWCGNAAADVQSIYIAKELSDDSIIILTAKGEQLLLEKWSLRFSPLVFEGKHFTADVTPLWVTIYFEDRDAIKWSVEKSLGYVSPSPKATVKPPPGTGVYAGIGTGHWIDQVLGDGKFILLEDGSMWEVSPLDVIYSGIWLPVSDIAVVRGSGPYPYRVINTSDGEKVDARYVGSK